MNLLSLARGSMPQSINPIFARSGSESGRGVALGDPRKPVPVPGATPSIMAPVQPEQQKTPMAPPPPMNAPQQPTANAAAPAPRTFSMLDRAKAAMANAYENATGGAVAPVVRDLLGPEAVASARRQSLLSLGSSLLADSGWKDARSSVTLGQALGRGLQASQQTFSTQVEGAVNDAVSAQNANALEAQKKAQEETMRAQAAQRDFDLQNDKRLIAAAPEYARILANVEGLPPEQQGTKYAEALKYAFAINDQPTAQKITTMFQSGMFKPVVKKSTWQSGGYGVQELRDDDTGEILKTRSVPTAPRGGGGGDLTLAEEDRRDGIPPDSFLNNVTRVMGEIPKMQSRARDFLQFAANPTGPDAPQRQIQALFTFMKQLDDSVVRESEVGLFRDAASLRDRLDAIIGKARSGRTFTPEQMQNIIGIMTENLVADTQTAKKRSAPYLMTGKKRGYAPEILAPFEETVNWTPPKIGTAAAPAASGARPGAMAAPRVVTPGAQTKAQVDARKKLNGG